MAKKGYKANRTSYPKGKSGNPGGKPKGLTQLRQQLRDEFHETAKKTWRECFASGDDKVRMAAVREYNDRVLGKPAEHDEVAALERLRLKAEIEKLKAEVELARAKAAEAGTRQADTSIYIEMVDYDKDPPPKTS